MTPTYTFVRAEPCPDESRFECITLAVPKDHRAAPGGPTWDVTFAIQRATGERKGTFVYIVGGPGGSGISVADSYTDYFDPSIAEAYDIVYVDQRGIGLSQPIQCIDAAATYYRDPNRLQVPAERPAAAAAAERFATDCIAEAGIAEADLPLYATSQAIEDLEAIRDYLDADQLHLFGESYGTQFVQTYAAAHPDRIATLFVDGPVDLTVDGIDYYIESTRGAEDTLVAVLRSCTADETCAANIDGGDALAAYDALAAQLATAPIAFDFPKADGTTESSQPVRRRPRERRLRVPVQPGGPGLAPARGRGRLQRQLRADRADGVQLGRRGPGDHGRGGRPHAGPTRCTSRWSARTTRSSPMPATRKRG